MPAIQIKVENRTIGDVTVLHGQRIRTSFTVVTIGFILLLIPHTSYLYLDVTGQKMEVPLSKKGALAGLLRTYLFFIPTIPIAISFFVGAEEFFHFWWPKASLLWLTSLFLFRYPFKERKLRKLLFDHTGLILKPSELFIRQRKELFENFKKDMTQAQLPLTAREWENRSPDSGQIALVFLYFLYGLENDHNADKEAIQRLLKQLHRNHPERLNGFSGPLIKDIKSTLKREERRARAELKRVQAHANSSGNQFRNWR